VLHRRRRDDVPQDNPDRWLLTYADLITLLLAFFVVMYSMSVMDAKKFGRVSEALHGILKGGSSALRPEEIKALNSGHGLLKIGDLKMLQTILNQDIARQGHSQEVMATMNERGLTIHIMESALFDEARADLKPRAKEILDMVTKDLIAMPNHVRVEGHTDDRPINTPRFPSNWELSTARATEVVRYLIEHHDYPPSKVSALGYASYRPYVPNTSVENRAKNRRVDIVVLTLELSALEPAADEARFVHEQVNAYRKYAEEIDSLAKGNNFPR
jgi:chemotaxis protein MotB